MKPRKQKSEKPEFIPGQQLSEFFYRKQVKPILAREFPMLSYSAALIGWGSEVLGIDTAISRDHHWGPRVLLFLAAGDYRAHHKKIWQTLARRLPVEFLGYSTNYGEPEPNGVRHPVKIDHGPVNHLINIYTTRKFLRARLGIDISQTLSVRDWLSLPQQRLLELTSGRVYHDGLGELNRIRRQLAYYPKDVWLYMLAAQWTRISQEEAFVGRAGDVGDELGSRIVAARLVRELIRLCLMMERQYVPYSKWLGSAFSKLRIARSLEPVLVEVLKAGTWKSREKWLSEAYFLVARQHNSLKLTKPLPTKTSRYFQRPYRVIHADEFARAIRQVVRDPEVRKIATDVGAIDQFTDSTNVIEDLRLGRRLKVIFR